ncbi:Crp/Fnr family transcriptional regulator [Mycobacterium sp. SM1]|uniref:Crp/Fnr family transcriptional regulator n=1 Tax=Mycobacterium sp. SM1 TaxID=2816243 RepID=UPI001BCD0DBE|nr:Crp/Fnr family transcriptional regulator [Mycobacterium sp. SM1]MBS4728654.1 Crp/Fnr family transcriptional regulator [Mycobacterium sp. SM1]
MSDQPAEPVTHIAGPLAGRPVSGAKMRHAAWVARYLGRGATVPLHPQDLSALAESLQVRTFSAGEVVFSAAHVASGVWIVRAGQIELTAGSGRRRAVIDVLRAGDVVGDIPLLLDLPVPYTARALSDTLCLFLDRNAFERLLAAHPAISRRWLSSVAQRVLAGRVRLSLLGRPLPTQLAQLLLDLAIDGQVELTQHTLAAMLGVRRPSINKILKEFEHDHLIRIGYAVIKIIDADGLRARAG